MSYDAENLPDGAELSVLEEVRALSALLHWYEAMGADEATQAEPHDRFAEFAAQAAAPAPALAPSLAVAQRRIAPRPTVEADVARPRAAPFAGLPSPEEALAQAHHLSASAQNLSELRNALEQFEGCALKNKAQRLVFGTGSLRPRLMVMGETPDRDDDSSGEPFSGARGLLLKRMLRAIGLAPAQVYLAQIVPWFPPGNAMPARHNIDACLPFAERQIELVAPQALLCLGWAGERLGAKKHPQWPGLHLVAIQGREIPALILPDLAEIMRSVARKRKSWEALAVLRRGPFAAAGQN